MDIQNLIKMVNRIGYFFESYPDKSEASVEIANHLKKFWEPRMRGHLLRHLDTTQGDGLTEIVLRALHAHRHEIEPGTRTIG